MLTREFQAQTLQRVFLDIFENNDEFNGLRLAKIFDTSQVVSDEKYALLGHDANKGLEQMCQVQIQKKKRIKT